MKRRCPVRRKSFLTLAITCLNKREEHRAGQVYLPQPPILISRELFQSRDR
ncbi:hypothetical protein ATPR_2860 [Acetobacter tropicalis NBRC 101654]|uniref:Uncharacterized protein n=1 Tax=Acetobacter tropicalis NBRC 101654 TaxID=749388 RepID=F7VHL1_9PROT|nr:hypothetical protein ATPR_2860 [Acetobacter tropicalis NBRC 101654]